MTSALGVHCFADSDFIGGVGVSEVATSTSGSSTNAIDVRLSGGRMPDREYLMLEFEDVAGEDGGYITLDRAEGGAIEVEVSDADDQEILFLLVPEQVATLIEWLAGT